MNKEQIIKKIYSSLPKSIDAYNIKQYILGFLFLRYIDASKYRKICEFKENITKKLEEYINEIHNIEEYNGLLSGVDLHHEQLGATKQLRNENIYNIMSAVLFFDIFDNTDIFGDIYEYLMFQYDSQAGSFGGEFFTPPEVAQLLANICTHQRTVQSVYDPTCGSGSLLLKVKASKYYGQEFNVVTYKLAKINLILHNIKPSDFNVAHGDTLSSPAHLFNKFDAIVSNPPYSTKWESDKFINDIRFPKSAPLAPNSKADLAFIMHSLYHLDDKGIASIVVFPGVLYRSGREQKIRKYLIDNNYIDCIIQLPSNIFYNTSITTCVLILKKNKEDNNILFIDASSEFNKEGDKNIINEDNIFNLYKSKQNIKHVSNIVDIEAVKNNDYSLSVNNYVELKNTDEIIDIEEVEKAIQECEQKIADNKKVIDAFVNSYKTADTLDDIIKAMELAKNE